MRLRIPRGAARGLLLAGALVLGGCEIQRISQGERLRADPHEWIIEGRTSKAEVLRIFGPPTRIQRQMDGDIFTYVYMRKDETSFNLEAPQVDVGITYTRVDEKSDRLVVLFDVGGQVKGFGYRAATEELPPTGLGAVYAPLKALVGNEEPEPDQRAGDPGELDELAPTPEPAVRPVSATAVR